MKTILYIIQKEFLQIFRNKAMLPLIFVMPVMQLIVLTYAVTFEMKQIRVQVVDHDLSTTSRNFITKLEGSPFYTIQSYSKTVNDGEKVLVQNRADLLIIIPEHFEKKIVTEKKGNIQFVINAINSTVAGLTNGYTLNVLNDYNKEISKNLFSIAGIQGISRIRTNYSFWYNPEMNYKIYMAPGIVVMLVTIIGLFLAGMNIVREKELGTIEQINVTPIKKYQFIIGKLTPFLIIGLFELAFGLTIAKIIFNIPLNGSLILIFFFAIIYLIVLLSMGLIVSTISNTQQQSMLFTWFFMVIFILMSGLFTPIENMPIIAQKANYLNPISYFVRVMRLVLIKGSGFEAVKTEFIMLGSYALIILSIAVKRYRKTI